MVEIGPDNMQNFVLLRDVGKTQKPVLLHRGPSATIDEWLMAAEYILAEGDLCGDAGGERTAGAVIFVRQAVIMKDFQFPVIAEQGVNHVRCLAMCAGQQDVFDF